jgi:hypothetical protein
MEITIHLGSWIYPIIVSVAILILTPVVIAVAEKILADGMTALAYGTIFAGVGLVLTWVSYIIWFLFTFVIFFH